MKQQHPPPPSTRNRLTGIILAVAGALAVVEATGYAFGTPARMGPGFLPIVLGGLLVLVGILIATIDQDGDPSDAPIAWRPAGFVLAAILAFALLIDRAGLAAATAALVAISGQADAELSWRDIGMLFLVLLTIVYLVFVQLLGIPFELVSGVL